jgi:predicted regulator of Ras-like GTPase activity (Roadblock/LC7/MglB family)
MDAAQALSDLTEVSSQIEAALVLDADGEAVASTLDEQRAPEFAQVVQELLAAVRRAAGTEESGAVAQAEIATGDGSVFLVRDEQRTIAATTGPEPTVGLVFYDLKSCLRSFAEEAPKPKPRPRRAKKDEEAEEPDAAA